MLRSVSTACLLIAMVTRVDAQPSSAQAEALFRQGKQLMGQKKFAEACEAFDASQKLDPSIATMLNQADCREQNGQLATAWGLFLDAERQTRSSSDRSAANLGKVATQRAAKLEARLSKLTIVVAADAKLAGLQVMRNTDAVDSATWNRELPIDGGTYTITAKAPGHKDFSTSITVGVEKDAKSVTVPKLADAPAAPVVAQQPTTPTTTGTEALTSAETEVDEVPTASGGKSKVVPIVLGVGALALFGGAIAFELAGRSTYDDAKAEPDNAKQDELWKSANRKRYIAEGMAVGGLACAGVAVWLFVKSSGSTETTTAARGVSVEPMLAIGGGGVLLQGRY
jgi:hypothetical protein